MSKLRTRAGFGLLAILALATSLVVTAPNASAAGLTPVLITEPTAGSSIYAASLDTEWVGVFFCADDTVPLSFFQDYFDQPYTGRCDLMASGEPNWDGTVSRGYSGKYIYAVAASYGPFTMQAVSEPVGPITPDVYIAPPAAVSDPQVLGFTDVGQELYADRGEWTTTDNARFEYEWYRCNPTCSPILEMGDPYTDQHYTLTEADAGGTVKVKITVIDDGGTVSAFSPESERVWSILDQPVNIEPPAYLTNSIHPGQDLQVSNGTWDQPDDELTFTYSWQWGNEELGHTVSATGDGNTYHVTDADLGNDIFVDVTAYNATGRTTAFGGMITVSAYPPVSTTAPQILGTATSGETLTVEPGTWDSELRGTFYQWMVCDDECVDIDDAEGTTFELTDANVGHRFAVRESVYGAGGWASATSEMTDVVAARVLAPTGPRPVITGTPRVGETLTMTVGEWSGDGPLTNSYSWANCEEQWCDVIAGASSPTLTVTPDMVGYLIVGRVDVTGPGGTDGSPSLPTAPVVAAPTVSLGVQATTAGDTIEVTGRVFQPDSDVTVTLYSDPVQLGVAHTDAEGNFGVRYVLPANTPAGDHHIVLGGLDAAGNTVTVETPLTVTAYVAPTNDPTGDPVAPADGAPTGTTTSSGTLPFTGFPALSLALFALVVIAAGSGLTVRSRNQR